jgi:hypothetical protein
MTPLADPHEGPTFPPSPRLRRTGRSGDRRPLKIFAAVSAAFLFVVVVGAATVIAGDSSYGRVVSRLRSEYRATEQPMYGAGLLGELAVAFLRPAGVSKAKFTMLRDLDVRQNRSADFNRIVLSAVESKWRPLVVRSAPARGEWTYVYAQPDGQHIRLLVVNRDHSDAVVAEVRVDPDKLSAFIDNPQILGIRLESTSGTRR